MQNAGSGLGPGTIILDPVSTWQKSSEFTPNPKKYYEDSMVLPTSSQIPTIIFLSKNQTETEDKTGFLFC